MKHFLALIAVFMVLGAVKPMHPTVIKNMLFWVHPETLSGLENTEIKIWKDGSKAGNNFVAKGKGPLLRHNVVNSYPALWFEGNLLTNKLKVQKAVTLVSVSATKSGKWQISSTSLSGVSGFQIMHTGYVAELICYEGDFMRTSELTNIVIYLNRKYGL